MAEHLADLAEWCPLVKVESRDGVAQLVKADPRKSSARQQWIEVNAPESATIERRARGACEDQAMLFPERPGDKPLLELACSMAAQTLDRFRNQPHIAL